MPEAGAGRLSCKDTNLAGGAGDKTQPPVQAEDGQRQQGGEPQTDRSPQGSSAASGGELTSQLCHRPAGRAWERLPLLPCLSFPVCKVRSRLQTHAFIILSVAAGAGTLQTSHVSASPWAPCRALPGGGARERLTGGRRETRCAPCSRLPLSVQLL